MIKSDDVKKTLGIANEKMEIIMGYNRGIYIKEWIHKGIDSGCLSENPEMEVFVLDIEGTKLLPEDFEVIKAESDTDNTQELISIAVRANYKDISILTCRLCILSNRDNSVEMMFQMKAEWEDDIPREIHLRLPFLSDFRLGQKSCKTFWFPAKPKEKKDGSSLMHMHPDFVMPLGILDAEAKKGFSLAFPAEFPWWQNDNDQINKISCFEELKNLELQIKPHNEFSDIVVININAINEGWREFFDTWRNSEREKYSLDEYNRAEAQWYKSIYLQHFTYIYGKEAFNYETRKVDAEKLAVQGKKFGGYDAVILWHQYPRLGVDERTQWDFYRDFPDGLEGILNFVQRLHNEGIKVFLPFKPWDLRSCDSLDDAGNKLAELVEAADIDGFFLDTMNSIPVTFRHCIDRVKSGVVFCSEDQPYEKQNIESMTGSWDSSDPTPLEINANLLRFVLPEHLVTMNASYSTGIRKDMLIKRSIFNGSGMVIWQDVFGAWLPYSGQQMLMIKKWKEILSANRDIFFCSKPIPLFPTLKDELFCNYFPADDNSAVIYVFYNGSDENMDGELADYTCVFPKSAEELWRGSEARVCGYRNGMAVRGTVSAKDVAIIKIVLSAN